MADFFIQTLTNDIFLSVILSYMVAGLIKMFFNFLMHEKMDLRVFLRTGGMPSSHTASVAAMTASVYFLEGVSNLFIVCLILSLIIMSDAVGIRRAAGKQAQILNSIIEEYTHFRRIKTKKLYELLGHTPKQVVVGILLGIFIAWLIHII